MGNFQVQYLWDGRDEKTVRSTTWNISMVKWYFSTLIHLLRIRNRPHKNTLTGVPILNLSYDPFTKNQYRDLQKENSLEGLNEAAALLPKSIQLVISLGSLFGCTQKNWSLMSLSQKNHWNTHERARTAGRVLPEVNYKFVPRNTCCYNTRYFLAVHELRLSENLHLLLVGIAKEGRL